MTDLEFLKLIKTVFKDHLKAPEGCKPSFHQLLETIEQFREEVINDYKLTQNFLRNGYIKEIDDTFKQKKRLRRTARELGILLDEWPYYKRTRSKRLRAKLDLQKSRRLQK